MDLFIEGVSEGEYEMLKSRESEIVSRIKNWYGELFLPQISDLRLSFKYDNKKNGIGIYIGDSSEPELVTDITELGSDEQLVACHFIHEIEKELKNFNYLKK